VVAVAGWSPAQDLWRYLVTSATAGLIIIVWHHLIRNEAETRKVLLGLFAVAGCCFGLFASIDRTGAEAPVQWIWTAAFLLLAEPCTRSLRWILRLVSTPPESGGEPEGRGELIGILERWLLLIIAVRGDYTAIAFIIAAKALARHSKFDNPDFAEYFLVGTLASLLMAVAVAEFLRSHVPEQ